SSSNLLRLPCGISMMAWRWSGGLGPAGRSCHRWVIIVSFPVLQPGVSRVECVHGPYPWRRWVGCHGREALRILRAQREDGKYESVRQPPRRPAAGLAPGPEPVMEGA